MQLVPHPISEMSNDEVVTAIERGRLMAARALVENPDRRRELEDRYGFEAVEREFPEVYWGGFGDKLDRVKPFR